LPRATVIAALLAQFHCLRHSTVLSPPPLLSAFSLKLVAGAAGAVVLMGAEVALLTEA
jgi:hypothetical protein